MPLGFINTKLSFRSHCERELLCYKDAVYAAVHPSSGESFIYFRTLDASLKVVHINQ